MIVNVCQNYSHSKLLINSQCELNKSGEQCSKLNIKTGFEEIFGTAIGASPHGGQITFFQPLQAFLTALLEINDSVISIMSLKRFIFPQAFKLSTKVNFAMHQKRS